MHAEKTNVVVVGAGLSGLCAAKKFVEHGVDVVVLEARNRVGGRTYTKKSDKIKWVDLGAAYVGPTQGHVLKLVEELGIKTCSLEIDLENTISIHYSDGKHFMYNTVWSCYGISSPFAWLDILYVLNKIDKMAKEIYAEDPWNSPGALQLDQISLLSFLESNCSTKHGLQFCIAIQMLNLSAHPAYISLLWALWYIKCCGGMMRMCSVNNGAQERKLHGGSISLLEALAKIVGDKLHLSSEVCKITQNGNGAIVLTTNGHTYEAGYVVMTIPLSMQLKIHYDPPLTLLKNQLIQRSPLNCVLKVMIYYEFPFWKKKKMSSLILCSDENICLNFVQSDTHSDSTHAELVIFIFGHKAIKIHQLDKEERKMKIVYDLALLYQCNDALSPVHYEDMEWGSEQYSGGGYCSAFPLGAFSHFGKALREPFNRVHYAGTETATIWPGYMNGAVQAGGRASSEILLHMGITPMFKDTVEFPEFLPLGSSYFEKHPVSVPTALFFATVVVSLFFIPVYRLLL